MYQKEINSVCTIKHNIQWMLSMHTILLFCDYCLSWVTALITEEIYRNVITTLHEILLTVYNILKHLHWFGIEMCKPGRWKLLNEGLITCVDTFVQVQKVFKKEPSKK